MSSLEEPEENHRDEDLEKILGSIERLHQTIEDFNHYVYDLKSYLEGYLIEDLSLTEFSSIEEYYRYKEMPPISEEEVNNMNIDELLENLTKPKER